MNKLATVVSCEHATNYVPLAFQYLFQEQKEVLKTHRGWDPGALYWAKSLAEAVEVNCFHAGFSRLLIEANRSVGNAQLFSIYSEGLTKDIKKYLINQYYKPYRRSVEEEIDRKIRAGNTVVHISMHSFTPVLDGEVRQVDIGLLFDDDRSYEWDFCRRWKDGLNTSLPNFNVRFNEPYLGKDDGFCTSLRTKYPNDKYLGIELEVNQKFVDSGKEAIAKALITTFKKTTDDYQDSRSTSVTGRNHKD